MLLVLILSIFFMILSTEWIVIWSAMEINMIIFLTFIKSKFFNFTEFEFKYFFIQFFGSVFFLLSMIFNNMMFFFISMNIKLLMFPFLVWIFYSLNWLSNKLFIIFSLFQKIGPLLILWNLSLKMNYYVLMFLILNIFWSVMKMKIKMMVYEIIILSSIIHVCFMQFLMNLCKTTFFIYFFFYILNSYLFLNLKIINNWFINMLIYMSMSGFPLYFFFFLKLKFFDFLSMNNIVFSIFLIFTSCWMFYFYMKLFLKKFFFQKTEKKVSFKKFISLYLYFFYIQILSILII